MLCQQVAWVEGPWVLMKFEVTRPQSFLHPKLADRQVAHLTDATTSADPDGGRSIGADLHLRSNPKILCQAFEPEGFTGALEDAAEL